MCPCLQSLQFEINENVLNATNIKIFFTKCCFVEADLIIYRFMCKLVYLLSINVVGTS